MDEMDEMDGEMDGWCSVAPESQYTSMISPFLAERALALQTNQTKRLEQHVDTDNYYGKQ